MALTFLVNFPLLQVIVVSLVAGLVVLANFGLSAGGCAKVLGAAVIFTGTMSLNAGELCATTQFFNLRYFPRSDV
jgi:hypothetical protein